MDNRITEDVIQSQLKRFKEHLEETKLIIAKAGTDEIKDRIHALEFELRMSIVEDHLFSINAPECIIREYRKTQANKLQLCYDALKCKAAAIEVGNLKLELQDFGKFILYRCEMFLKKLAGGG